MAGRRRIAVVGGGWAGIAAALAAARRGGDVALYEMAGRLGGRARQVVVDGLALDNGQHILIGAYRETLALVASVGVAIDDAFERRPLELLYPDGAGLRLPPGPPVAAFVRGVATARGWSARERWRLLRTAARWAASRFRCAPTTTVSQLAERLPVRLRDELIEPLCAAALNTPAGDASGAAFLHVLREALFAGRGASDLLLPRRSLSALLPEPASARLREAGAVLRLGHRVASVARDGDRWRVDDETFDAVVLACSATEAARLAGPIAPAWAATAAALDHEPIVTVYLTSAGTRLQRPMVALRPGAQAPAQFVFDHGALGGPPGVFAAVVSAARAWTERGAEATGRAAQRQLLDAFPAGTWREPLTVLRTMTEKRATFRCTPALQRPAAMIAPALCAAGDYVDGPYPATLEGAVRSGLKAVAAVV